MNEVRSRREVTNEKIERANSMRAWFSDARAAAFERRALKKKAALLTPQPHGSGVTVDMRQISAQAKLRDQEALAIHEGPNRAMRRAHASHRATPASINHTYVNPARDLKPGRRLRVATEA
jgi:hypothetical protein